VFLLGLEGSLGGIAIQVCAALVFYVGDNFGYFHRLYLAEVPKLPFLKSGKHHILCFPKYEDQLIDYLILNRKILGLKTASKPRPHSSYIRASI